MVYTTNKVYFVQKWNLAYSKYICRIGGVSYNFMLLLTHYTRVSYNIKFMEYEMCFFKENFMAK